jgi:hypothetical protein
VVTEAVVAMHRSLLDGAVQLGAWRQAEGTDASDAMREYRDYLDRLLEL